MKSERQVRKSRTEHFFYAVCEYSNCHVMPADAGSLCNKSVLLAETLKELPCGSGGGGGGGIGGGGGSGSGSGNDTGGSGSGSGGSGSGSGSACY